MNEPLSEKRGLLGEPLYSDHPDWQDRGPRLQDPKCRWCGETEAEHKPDEGHARPAARVPCLGWRENFVARQDEPGVVEQVDVPSSDGLRLVIGGPQVWRMDASGRVETWNGGHQLSLSFNPPQREREAWAAALAKETQLLVTIEAAAGEGELSNQPLHPVTDAQRMTVLNEVLAGMSSSGGSTVIAFERYYDKVKESLGR